MSLLRNQGRSSASRFAETSLAELFGVPAIQGTFADDRWNLRGHTDLDNGGGKHTINFLSAPEPLRDALKEFLLIATRPEIHAADEAPGLVGVRPKDIKTVQRWLGGLTTDLSWLRERTGRDLHQVVQSDFDALKDALELSHRRIGALKAFARYSEGMSPNVDRLQVMPWVGESAYSVGEGKGSTRGRNTTPLFQVTDMAPWLETAMLLVGSGERIIDVATLELITDPNEYTTTGKVKNSRTRERPPVERVYLDGQRGLPLLSSDCDRRDAVKVLKHLAAACAFVTVAFTGMRASEFEAIPRGTPLGSIDVAGARRWTLSSYLIKGLPSPKPEKWLVPPIVAEAVSVMKYLLDRSGIEPDRPFVPTGLPPLFDRRALAKQVRSNGPSVMRLERVMSTLQEAINDLSALGLVQPYAGPQPNGRRLRRNFAVIVAGRDGGPQAAMEQFKWQDPKTASGYFRVSSEGVALGQRDVYEEVAEIHADMVVDALRDEFEVWERQVQRGVVPALPTGPDGRRKRDVFASVRNSLQDEPRVEEDPRRLRALLRTHADTMHLTEFGWCDWDESVARCGGVGGPVPSMCDPEFCLNHSTPSTAIAAHISRYDRLVQLSRDRTFPPLAREKARDGARAVERHLGEHLEET